MGCEQRRGRRKRRGCQRLYKGGVSATAPSSLEEGGALLVGLDLCDDDVGRVDADGDGRAVGLLPVDTLDVDDVLLAVHLGDLSFPALVGTPGDEDLIVLANGDGAGRVLASELLAQSSRHDDPTDGRRGIEVRLARLAAG